MNERETEKETESSTEQKVLRENPGKFKIWKSDSQNWNFTRTRAARFEKIDSYKRANAPSIQHDTVNTRLQLPRTGNQTTWSARKQQTTKQNTTSWNADNGVQNGHEWKRP